jgi:hypothetical protein
MGNCKNVGTADRAVRALIGIAALVLAFTTLGVMAGAVWGIRRAGHMPGVHAVQDLDVQGRVEIVSSLAVRAVCRLR